MDSCILCLLPVPSAGIMVGDWLFTFSYLLKFTWIASGVVFFPVLFFLSTYTHIHAFIHRHTGTGMIITIIKISETVTITITST